MPPLRVMVVDDTVTYRSIMSKVVQAIPQLVLVDTAINGKIALDKMAVKPIDLMFLDVEMPVLDGISTLKEVKQRYPNVTVVFVSAINRAAADTTIKALQMGAVDFITKPDGGSPQDNYEELLKRVKQVLTVFPGFHTAPVKTEQRSSTLAQPRLAQPPRKQTGAINAVVIGVSTGGPNALAEVIPKLTNAINVPVLIVQHMPPVFTQSLAASLDRQSQLTVKEAAHGELLQGGFVYIAPGGHHMAVVLQQNQPIVNIMDTPPENSCRPAVDVLFRSAGQVYGGNVLSVILTGMGSDGQKGTAVLKQYGAYCLTQSKESCVVYGMPRAVDEAGLSDERVPLPEMASRINQLICGGNR
jgi:two-component system, chemotaxis family, protein-glutamate methylesterase/glutaminase